MEECEFCGEEFEGEEALRVHWLEEHEDELNSHQKDNAKKAKRNKEEREKVRKEHRKKRMYQGVGALVLIGIGVLLGPQILSAVMPSGSTEISLEGEPMIGSQDANVTVVEFGDFQCPACNRFEQSSYNRLKSEYIDSGQVKFYWKDYPLEQIHPWARTGAETMECVYRQDETAFWEVKGQLFDEQSSLSTSNAQSRIIGWAEEEGVNGSEVRSCLQNSDVREEVNSDIREGQGNGVTGTPTIYVNGKKLNGFGYQTVQSAIEEELN
jgi:protein-disulfide isomerase